MILKTARLRLHPLTVEHTEPYTRLMTDVVVTRLIGGPKTKEEMAEKTKKDALTWSTYGYGRFAIESTETGKIIGMAGVWKSNIDDFHFNEVGYAVFEEYWGKGFTTEAMRAIVEFAEKTVQLKQLNAVISPENMPSKRVVEKLGFHFARIVDRVNFKNAELWQKG